MKKQLIIIGIIVLFVCVSLTGCDSKVGNANTLEGTWKGSIDASITTGLGGKITELTFTSNSVFVTYTIPPLQPGTFSGTYQIQGNKLPITNPTPGYNSYSLTYSINGNKLYLDGSEFTKQ